MAAVSCSHASGRKFETILQYHKDAELLRIWNFEWTAQARD